MPKNSKNSLNEMSENTPFLVTGKSGNYVVQDMRHRNSPVCVSTLTEAQKVLRKWGADFE